MSAKQGKVGTKQDRTGVRTAAQLEQKYKFGKTFAETLGLATDAQETANKAQVKANNSVQLGENYSNVSMTEKDGFVATKKDGTFRVVMNANDCFAIQKLQNNEWVTVNSLEEFGLLINRLTSLSAKDNFYISVGEVDINKYGLLFYIDGNKGLSIASGDSNSVTLSSPKTLKLKTEQTIELEASAFDAISHIIARNLSLETANLISNNTDTGAWGRGVNGSCKLTVEIDGTNTTGDFEIINGIITKFPGMSAD